MKPLTIIALCIVLSSILACTGTTTTPSKPTPPTAEMQSKRSKAIAEMIRLHVFTKTEVDGKHSSVWTGPTFDGMSFDQRLTYVSVVFLYYHESEWTKDDPTYYTDIYDGRTGKQIGNYNPGFGGLTFE